jgi:hypothetical protein
MGAIFRDFGWKDSRFGLVENWRTSLVSMVSLVMSSSSPMALWWGPEHLLIYNDGYIPIAGDKHPAVFGQPAAMYWGDSWPRLQPTFARVFAGQSVSIEDESVVLHRGDTVEVHPFIRSNSGNVSHMVLYSLARTRRPSCRIP